MKITFPKLAAAGAMACITASAIMAQDAEAPRVEPSRLSRQELIDKQLDVSLEARDIERILAKIKRASDLSKQRITEAAAKAESVSGALERGDSKDAKSQADETTAMLKEVTEQLRALLVEETPQRVAAAKELAEKLTREEREFLKKFPGILNSTAAQGKGKVDPNSLPKPKDGERPKGTGGDGVPQDKPNPESKEGGAKREDKADPQQNEGAGKPEGKADPQGKEGENGTDPKEPKDDAARNGAGQEKATDEGEEGEGGMSEEERKESLAKRAEELAASGQTLADVLKSITQSTDPADQEAVKKIDAILKETDLLKALDAMQEAAGMIRDGKLDDARLSGMDVGDRLEITAQRLDAAYRGIVAPKAEELRKIEAALAALRERLNELETQDEIAAWHREVRELMEKLSELGISEDLIEQLQEQMRLAGVSNGLWKNVDWSIVEGRYAAPAVYNETIIRIEEDIQERLQTLLVGDIRLTADDAAPPKYKDLVNRYYDVLSKETPSTKPRSK